MLSLLRQLFFRSACTNISARFADTEDRLHLRNFQINLVFRSVYTIFAALFKRESIRDVVQLVVYLVWDQGVARSSRVIPTNYGIICL